MPPAKGPRPLFFEDESGDLLVSLILALTQEVAVDRVRTSRLEAALSKSGQSPIAAPFSAEEQKEVDELVERVVGQLRAFQYDQDGSTPVPFQALMDAR